MANARRESQRERSNAAREARSRQARKQRLTKAVAIGLVIALAVTGVAAFQQIADSRNREEAASTTTTTAAPTPCPPAEGSAERRIDFAGPPQMCIDPAKKYSAAFETTEGIVKVDLDTQRTPATVNNFVVLARYGYYDGTDIFRLVPSIAAVQGGSPHTQDNSDQGPGYNIPDEGSGFTYNEGDLIMARSSGPDSGGAQYFFASGPEVAGLNSQGNYVTFGKTTEGLDVLKKIIALVPPGSEEGAPTKPVVVNKVTITES